MKKTFTSLLLASIALLSACAPNVDKQASTEYVDAANNVISAKKLFENADFAQALSKFEQARAQVNNIPTKYPSSAIALKLVSESDVMLAMFELEEIDSIIEKLKTITSASNQKIARTVAIAELADSHAKLYNCVINSEDLSDKEKSDIISANKKLTVLARNAKTKNAKNDVTSEKTVSPTQKKKLSEQEVKTLLDDAQKNATRCAFEISASEELLKKSELVDETFRAEFSKILRKGHSRAKIITIAKLREIACANLAAAAAKSGDDELALEIISQIKNPEAFEDVFSKLASSLGKTKNYPAALAIASNVKNQKIKDAFLMELSQNVAEQNRILAAIEIAKQISSVKERNIALAKIAVFTYDKSDYKNFVTAMSNFDISDLSFSSEFSKYAKKECKTYIAGTLATLAKITIPINKKIAKILTDIAKKEYTQNSNFNSEIELLIAENLLALDALNEVLDFANRSKSPMSRAKIAMKIVAKDKPMALKILADTQEEISPEGAVEFSFLVETSTLSDEEKTKSLEKFLKLK